MSIEVKRGDTHTITLAVSSDGAPVDLTSATVRILVRPTGSSTTSTELAATVTDAPGGTLTHTLTGTLAVGPWDVEVEVTRDGQITTYPSTGFERINMRPDLG